jgi:acetyl esterase/lipase
LSDGIAAYDYLIQNKKAKANQIIAMGSSMGTGIAANTALNRNCAALLLVAPYNSLAQAACDNINYFKLYPSFLFPQPDISCMPFMVKDKQSSDASEANASVQSASSSATQPVVIIHGALDQRIPVTHSRQLIAAYKETHQTKAQSNTQSKDDSPLRYVELPNCHHGDIPLNIITDELNGIVARLEASKKTLLSKK